MKLAGKAAIVTGGGTGVGRATALALAERGCGVVVNYSKSAARGGGDGRRDPRPRREGRRRFAPTSPTTRPAAPSWRAPSTSSGGSTCS